MEILSANNYQLHKEMDRESVFLGLHDKKNTGKRICLRTGIYESDFNNPALHETPYKGRGWHADFRTYNYEGKTADDNYLETMLKLRERGYIWNSFITYFDEKERREVNRSQPELMIYADSYNKALSAVRLIPAAISVFNDNFIDIEQWTGRYGWNLDERMPYLIHEIPDKRFSMHNIAQAVKIVTKASHSNNLKYSILRYWASKKLCAVDYMVTHGKADYGAGLTNNPIAHTLFSQAIVLAYGAIEELNFDFQPKTQKGLSSNEVRDRAYIQLEKRLEKSDIHPNTEIFWATASKKRKIDTDKTFTVESIREIQGVNFNTNTKTIKLIDAIYLASRLRSNLSTHKFKKNTFKLTSKDVWNTQSVARYLICHQAKILHEMPVMFF